MSAWWLLIQINNSKAYDKGRNLSLALGLDRPANHTGRRQYVLVEFIVGSYGILGNLIKCLASFQQWGIKFYFHSANLIEVVHFKEQWSMINMQG